MYIPIFVSVLLLSFPLSATETTTDQETYFPHRMSGKDLLTACSSSSLTHSGRRRINFCRGFVSGVEEGIWLQEMNESQENSQTFCVPPATTSRQMARAFVTYASGRHRNLGKPAVMVVVEALKTAFPCNR